MPFVFPQGHLDLVTADAGPGGSAVGDVLLARFLAAVVDELSPEDTLRLAVAAGAASVRDVGAGRFDPQVAGTIAANVELAELQPARS